MLIRSLLGVSVLSLAAARGCGYSLPDVAPPTAAETCTLSSTWAVVGFEPDQLGAPPPDALWKATLRRGETVPLRVTTLGSPSDQCAPFVAAVTWGSSAPEVADATSDGTVTAQLAGRSLGEAVIWATVTTSVGGTFRADTFALAPGSTRLERLYGVVVVR